MEYNKFMVIKETSVFTKIISELLPDDSYRKLQTELIKDPELGDIIKGSGGIRKYRWAVPGRGKSGGLRIIYYWITADEQIYMLYAYPKSKQENMSPAQIKLLKSVVEEELSNE